ncbi:MAG: 50S ribosomal protein L25/general stress protein Ctc [Betaproteobacteria bacterium]
MKIEISAQKRTTQGTGASRRLRNAGRVPGIVYGGNSGPVNIELDHKELLHKLTLEAFHASILSLDVEGAKEQVLLRAFNMHPYKGRVQHIDFQRVSADKKIHMKVPLHFVNAEISPAVKTMGAVANHVLNELDVRCFPADLPEFIEVDLGALTVGDSVHVSDLKMPKGVEAAVHRGANPVVATMIVPALIVEEEVAAAEVPAAADVPTTEQAAPEKAAEGAGGDKAGDKAGGKGEAKASDKKEKK